MRSRCRWAKYARHAHRYFPYSSFEDLETGEQIPVVPTALAQQYRSLVQEHIAALSSRFSQNRVDYSLVNTTTPLDYALFKYLSARQRLSRVR